MTLKLIFKYQNLTKNKFKLHMLIPTSINRIQKSTTKGTKESQALKDKSRAFDSEHLK